MRNLTKDGYSVGKSWIKRRWHWRLWCLNPSTLCNTGQSPESKSSLCFTTRPCCKKRVKQNRTHQKLAEFVVKLFALHLKLTQRWGSRNAKVAVKGEVAEWSLGHYNLHSGSRLLNSRIFLIWKGINRFWAFIILGFLNKSIPNEYRWDELYTSLQFLKDCFEIWAMKSKSRFVCGSRCF